MKRIKNNMVDEPFQVLFGTEHPRQSPTMVSILPGATEWLEDDLWEDIVGLLTDQGETPETYELEVTDG